MTYPGTKQWLLVIGLCLLIRTSVTAVWDSDKEHAIADKVSAQLKYGELIWLHSGKNSDFPAIYTLPVYNYKQRAVILLHSMSAHMDWPVVITPLRESLRDEMWASLSIQLPVIATEKSPAEYSKTLDEAARRIHSAVQYLRGEGHGKIVLIGYGFGATTAAFFLAGDHTHGVQAFVGISMLARKYLAPHVNLLAYLEKLYLPVLDIYGSNDLPVIVRTADDRRLFSQKNGTYQFSQVIIEGADHYYTGCEQTLVDNIINWLEGLDSTHPGISDNQATQEEPAIHY